VLFGILTRLTSAFWKTDKIDKCSLENKIDKCIWKTDKIDKCMNSTRETKLDFCKLRDMPVLIQ